VTVGAAAHGGHFVARHEGRVVFVRHALPGEQVVVEVTEGDEGSRFLRADAVEVLAPSPDRVAPPCRFSGPGGCGGCDFQHVALGAQRLLKASVVREQMRRLAGLEVAVEVEAVPGDLDGLGWRTRVQYAVDPAGHAGLRKHRSHEVVRIDRCLIAHPGLPPVVGRRWPGADAVEAVVSASGERLRVVRSGRRRSLDGTTRLRESAAGRAWQVTGSGFWQVHPGAADALVAAVVDGLDPRPGETAADLYAGVGLFAAAMAERVGSAGSVVAVEADEACALDAADNLADLPSVELISDRVERALARGAAGRRRDLVVLDPPRSGAGRRVAEGLTRLRPRAVAYVSCEPAPLARDVATFAGLGYELRRLRAFDLFPMTHHVECVATLVRMT
jgi:tRNA/tmRNA/rRNA uracil-C5-methylase (TrmA/RlmC/RlmD family)